MDAVGHNRLRAMLTSLGIIFGVASVISMLAIGRGAQEEILNQIKLLGANNIIVIPLVEQEEGSVDAEDDPSLAEKRPFSPGLTLHDANSIASLIPGVEAVSPEVVIETTALRAGLRRSTKLIGVDRSYFQTGDFELAEGNLFSATQIDQAAPVAIIGHDVKTKFFPQEEAIGNRIKCGRLWLTVIGVLKPRNISEQQVERLGIRNFDLDIYTPITTQLLRFEDRQKLTAQDLQQAQRDRRRGIEGEANYHQVDRLVVQVGDSQLMRPVADVVTRMLERRHYGVVDFEVIIPEVLLQQERRTQNIFNIVLAAIASISLVVGGIGIMNIMLASVMERTREIGVRRAVGATSRDVVMQFLIEAIVISFTGGILGILLGVGLSLGIEQSTGIATEITATSILLAFLVSVTVGLVFGLLPARRAAMHDPVYALRHE